MSNRINPMVKRKTSTFIWFVCFLFVSSNRKISYLFWGNRRLLVGGIKIEMTRLPARSEAIVVKHFGILSKQISINSHVWNFKFIFLWHQVCLSDKIPHHEHGLCWNRFSMANDTTLKIYQLDDKLSRISAIKLNRRFLMNHQNDFNYSRPDTTNNSKKKIILNLIHEFCI